MEFIIEHNRKEVRGRQLTHSIGQARQKVLGEVKNSIVHQEAAVKIAVEAQYKRLRYSDAPRPVVDGILTDRFIEKHTAVHGTFKIVQAFSQVPAAVNEFLAEHCLPTQMVMPNTEFMSGFDWDHRWQIERRRAKSTDVVSVTDAVCAIAETGTFVMTSSPEVSSTQMFLPENHVVILDAGQIVRHLEDAISICSSQETYSRGMHMITGPSKTADVEQTIQYGAHGPRLLHAVIINRG